MPRPARDLILCLAALLLPLLALAAEDEAYDFEMIIFERPDGGVGEYWPEEPGEPDRGASAGRLDRLPQGAGSLDAEAAALRRRGMLVHLHRTWRQVPGSRDGSPWYSVDAGRLSGLVRVSRGRFLHLDTDLLLRDPGAAQAYRIQLRRRMRSGELHYVDHPKIGILIQAERYEAPAPAAPPSDIDATDGEPRPAQPISGPAPAG